jgi:hypothetical protein
VKIICALSLLCIFLVWIACNESDNLSKQSSNKRECAQPIKDPNNPKPMALMMRTMADYCDSMKVDLLAGKTVDSIRYPLMPFKHAEPSDSSNLIELFYNNADRFAAAYRKLMQDTQHQKENYTAVINECIHCHNSFCSGPLRRIRKLPLDYVSN